MLRICGFLKFFAVLKLWLLQVRETGFSFVFIIFAVLLNKLNNYDDDDNYLIYSHYVKYLYPKIRDEDIHWFINNSPIQKARKRSQHVVMTLRSLHPEIQQKIHYFHCVGSLHQTIAVTAGDEIINTPCETLLMPTLRACE